MFLAINSCKKNNSSEEFQIISVNTKNFSEKIKLSSIAETPDIIKLYTDSIFMIGDIRQIKYEDKIYIQNFQKILAFNENGTPSFVINKQGKAGAEYYEINDFHINKIKNQVEVWDRVKRTMFYYNQSGKFIKSVKLNIDANYFKKIDNYYFFYSSASFSGFGEKASRIYCLNEKGDIINEFLKSDHTKLYSFSTPHFLSVSGNALYYDDAPLNKIYKITEKGCDLAYVIDVDGESMTLNDLMEMKDLRSGERFRRITDLYCYSIGITRIWDNGIYLEVNSKRKGYHCFYFPQQKKTLVGTELIEDYFLNGSIYFSNISDNKIICLLPAYKLKAYKENDDLREVNQELFNIIRNSRRLDNPVLFVANLK